MSKNELQDLVGDALLGTRNVCEAMRKISCSQILNFGHRYAALRT